MKAKDLMLGDWVVYDGDVEYINPIKIEGMDIATESLITSDRDDVGFDGIQPIPITPEILKKNGFKLKEEGETYSEYVSVWDEISIISFAFYKETLCGVDTLLECELGFAGGLNRIHHCHIKYVHQLQHALRLCGIGKEIRL